jgi:KUP system potassium uptake protein
MFGCIGVVLYFKDSEKMEAAYGLAVTLTMMMTTLLIASFLLIRRQNKFVVLLITIVFLSIEISFFLANATKFKEGGWVSILFGFGLFMMMFIWNRARALKDRLVEFESVPEFLPILKQLSADLTVPKYATHLVYLTASNGPNKIEKKILYSIFQRAPKRADVYWFIHINVVDEPYNLSYKTDILAEDDVVWITFNLGFRVEPRINLYFRMVVEELVRNQEIDIKSRYASLSQNNMAGDFRFVILESFLSYDNKLSLSDRLTMNGYYQLSRFSLNDKRSYGLDTSNVTVEKTPLVVTPLKNIKLTREF